MGSGKRLFLYGYFGRRNTGDDAMLYAFLSVANIVNPRLTFYVLHGEDVPKVPDRAKESIAFVPSTPTAVLRGLLAADVFVIAGGTHITGYGLNRRTVAMRTRIALLIAFSKLLGKKVYLLGVGVDTFRKTLPRHVARWICTRADAISVRDATSYETSRDLGAGDKTVLGFDLAALLDWKNSEIEPGGESTRNHTLGFSITPVFTLYHLDEESDRTLVLRLGEALNTWMRKHPEWRVNLFVAHGQSNRNRNDDLQITRQLLEVLA